MANENYEGFDLTIYNLFTLLREMYYTRGETETNFLSKSGGTLGGSLTIQGNLTVQGNSYKIDTENLVVKDYTITLAKDNNSALLSMVGMVVPKYDGTNYGFFGWDADGYAYVGDLTDYDGSSAITLAENTSLQKIATIKDTATGTTSDDVMVYDQTNKVFKKAPSGRYVIEDNELVASNDNNALYNLGSFDTISGNTITRQTWEVDLSKFNWTLEQGSGYWYWHAPFKGNQYFVADTTTNCKHAIYQAVRYNNDDFGVDNRVAYSAATIVVRTTSTTEYPTGILQYKLSTSYTESIIPNQPLLNLDSNGCNFLRNEWEKGLNLWNRKSTPTTNTIVALQLEQGKKYTFSYVGTATISVANNDYSQWLVWQNTNNTFTFTATTSTINIKFDSVSSISNIMLVEGNHPYPYQEYNGDIVHKVDIEPVLLWENSSPNSAFAPQQITTKDMSGFKYVNVVFKESGASSTRGKIIQKFVYEAGKDFTLGFNYVYQETTLFCLSRILAFTNSTTINVGKGFANANVDNDACVPVEIYGTNVL